MGIRMTNIATPMPQLRAKFTSKLGIPLSGCKVYTYEPNSNILKKTWLDIDKTVENTNPILLDAAGEADIYLDGLYRIVVKDRFGFVVYDVEKTGTHAEWDASFVVDASGKNQQEINTTQLFINAEILTPEMFGAVGDGVTDDTQALIDMFKACTDMPTDAGISASTINNLKAQANYKKIRLTRLYRHTKPIHIPPNVQIEQVCVSGFFSKNTGNIGFYYDPIDTELDTYAVSPFLYKKDSNGTYSLDTNPFTLPSGSQFDDGSYIQCGNRWLIKNLSITTKYGVLLGFRLVGCAGSILDLPNIGTNDGSNSKIPKVGVLTSGCWNTVINKPTVIASHQGWVNRGSNGGLTINNPYVNGGYTALTKDEILPPYTITGYEEKGSVAISTTSDAFWNQPITEHWDFCYVNSHFLRLMHPHIEGSKTRNAFYFVGGTAGGDITLKANAYVTREEKSSLVYVKGCTVQSAITLRGRLLGADPVIKGENSTACLSIEVDRNHFFIQTGKWGDINLIRSINNVWSVNTIYVDPLEGNDAGVGLRDLNPLKTMTYVKKLCELMNIENINILSDLTFTDTVNLPQKCNITGQALIGSTSSALLHVSGKDLSVRFANSKLSHTSQGLLYLNALAIGKISFSCELDCTTALIQAQNAADIDISIKNTAMSARNIVYGNESHKQTIGFNIDTTATLASALVGGNATIKYCNLDSASVAYDPPSIAANSEITTTVTLQATPIGTPVSAAFSIYNVAIEISAVVSAPNTVTVKFKNTSASAVDLASGNLAVKRI